MEVPKRAFTMVSWGVAINNVVQGGFQLQQLTQVTTDEFVVAIEAAGVSTRSVMTALKTRIVDITEVAGFSACLVITTLGACLCFLIFKYTQTRSIREDLTQAAMEQRQHPLWICTHVSRGSICESKSRQIPACSQRTDGRG